MKNTTAILTMLALVIAASGCASPAPSSSQVHTDVVQFLENDEDHKAVLGVIAGETGIDPWGVDQAQWKNHHDYTVKYYCFEKDDTEYCELKEEYR